MDRPPPTASFASDNTAGVLPEVMDALAEANVGTALAYGDDPWTARAIERFRTTFDRQVQVVFCWGGTGANVVGLGSMLRPWEGVICASTAHINVDECGAPERVLGTKLIDIESADGRLRPSDIERACQSDGSVHHVKPAVVSLTQSTESGTLYSRDQIAELCDVAHRRGLLVHMDGARLANAVAATGAAPDDLTFGAGVDVVSVGGTKAGAMYGDAVVSRAHRPELEWTRKQLGQLPSKLRFVAAQFDALLRDDLWIERAADANRMAGHLAAAVALIDGVELIAPPEVNAVFARLPRPAIDALQEWSFFWDWDLPSNVVRWMTHFDTTIDDVRLFAAGVAEAVDRHG